MHALIIANPVSGQDQHRAQLEAAATVMRDAGWEATIRYTDHAGDATRLAAEGVRDQVYAIFGAGGDGTLNEILQVIIDTPVALGVLPVGTANVWARELGIPLDAVGAAHAFLQSRPYLMDVGLVELHNLRRYFLLLASIGYDALVTGSIDPILKRQVGMIAYLVSGAQNIFSYVGTPVRIRMDQRRLAARLLFSVISNTRIYGGLVRVNPDAIADDGVFTIAIFRGRGWFETIRHYASIVIGQHRVLPGVEVYQSRMISIRSRRPLAVQVDGDYIGTTPARITCRHRRVRVLVPPSVDPDLFMHSPPDPERQS